MSNLQAVQDKIDNIKEKMSDGDYLELCNLMKGAFDAEKKKDELYGVNRDDDEEEDDEEDDDEESDEEDDDEDEEDDDDITFEWKSYFSGIVLNQYNEYNKSAIATINDKIAECPVNIRWCLRNRRITPKMLGDDYDEQVNHIYKDYDEYEKNYVEDDNKIERIEDDRTEEREAVYYKYYSTCLRNRILDEY